MPLLFFRPVRDWLNQIDPGRWIGRYDPLGMLVCYANANTEILQNVRFEFVNKLFYCKMVLGVRNENLSYYFAKIVINNDFKVIQNIYFLKKYIIIFLDTNCILIFCKMLGNI